MTTTGVVLQGGGALGAFEYGVLECLLDHDVRPDVVSGVSIGAINAAVFCGSRQGDARESLRGLWRDFATPGLPFPLDVVNRNMSVFGNPGMYGPRLDVHNFLGWTSFYDTSPLLDTLERHVDFSRLGPESLASNPKTPRLILTATNLQTGQLEKFDSKLMPITAAHVRASGSLPPGFPATAAPAEKGESGQIYWDGGLFDNTPLSKVISALQDNDDTDKIMFVVNLFPSAAPVPRNMPEVLARMMTIAFSNKSGEDLKRAHQTTHMIRFVNELEKVMARSAELRGLMEHPGFKALKKFKAPIDIVEITNHDVQGGSDFSAERIERRRKQGYAAAAEQIVKLRRAV